MPFTANDQTYYRTAEVCRMTGIGKTTFFRWLKEGTLNEPKYRDRRGWRLFTSDEIDQIRAEVNKVIDTMPNSRI